MDVFVIVMAVISCILLFIIDLYIMAIYSHKQQPLFSAINIACRVLIIISLLQVQMQPLFLIIDIVNSRDSTTDLTLFWIILFFSMLVNLAFFKPLLTSIYESDEEDPCWKITLWVIFEVCVSMGLFAIIVGVGWLLWGFIYVSIDIIQLPASSSLENSSYTYSSIQIVMQTDVICFLIGLFCLFGYPILACCGGCGLTVLPLSLILEFTNRPKYRRTSQAKRIRDYLKKETLELIIKSEVIQKKLGRLEYLDGWLARRQQNLAIEGILKQIEKQLEQHRDFYELFKMELQIQNINPFIFFGKLFLGILSMIAAIFLCIQILLTQLIFPVDNYNRPQFMQPLVLFMQKQNANFVSVALMMLFSLLLTCGMIKGSFFVSNLIPCFTIHPIKQGKTWLNSFLFQLSLCILGGTSMIHMLMNTFPHYLRGGQIALMMGQILDHMLFVGVFFRHKVFTYIFLIMTILGAILIPIKMLCFEEGKTELLQKIEQKRKKLFGKNNQNNKLIEMTEINLKDKSQQKQKQKISKRKHKNTEYTENSKDKKKKNKKKIKFIPI